MKKIIILNTIIILLLFSTTLSIGSPENATSLESQNTPTDTVEYWAILIGTNQTRFVEGVEQIRRSLIYQGWKDDHIKTLHYENATKSNFIKAIDWVIEHEDPWDTTLIYLHSHGGEGFFCLIGGNIYYDELDMQLDRLRSAAVGVVVDCCHSGSAIPYLKQSGRTIITACKADQGSGPICDGFANGFDELADYHFDVGNRNGVVSMEELYDYIWNENDWEEFNIEPQIQDDCPRDLHLSFFDWNNGLIDQMPESTSFGPGLSAVIMYNNGQYIYNNQRAQSFKPQADNIEKVKFHVRKCEKSDNLSSPILVSIRKELTGEDLTSKMLLPDEVYRGYTTFDFPDIDVISGSTYYIVCRATQEETNWDNRYSIYDDDDCYEDGMKYYTSYDAKKWRSHEDRDLFFVTYKENKNESLPPYVPRRPIGHVYGEKNTSYKYCMYTEDVNRDPVYYQFDWGDNTSTSWMGPYKSGETICETHKWLKNGTYHIRARAKDIHGMMNNWSSVLRVKIGNTQPNHPVIEGPLRGRIGKKYDYTFNATDPECDDLLYLYVDWGDGELEEWIGPYDSGEKITLSHTWEKMGRYTIKAKAKDIMNAESPWGALKIIMPRNRAITNSLFLWFLERFPNVFPILKQLIGL